MVTGTDSSSCVAGTIGRNMFGNLLNRFYCNTVLYMFVKVTSFAEPDGGICCYLHGFVVTCSL